MIANIAGDDDLILPYSENPNRIEFSGTTGTLNCMSRIRCSGSPDYELDRDRPLDNVPIEGV
jgi:hypothetical protein